MPLAVQRYRLKFWTLKHKYSIHMWTQYVHDVGTRVSIKVHVLQSLSNQGHFDLQISVKIKITHLSCIWLGFIRQVVTQVSRPLGPLGYRLLVAEYEKSPWIP